jgi:predicted nuclease of predicted toxin-antitoxin system
VRVLLDECVPRKLRRDLPGHQVQTVGELRWDGTKNGELLRIAGAAGFDALLTVDGNLPYQQNMSGLPVALIVLRVRSNALHALRQLVPEVLEVLRTLEPGQVYQIAAD